LEAVFVPVIDSMPLPLQPSEPAFLKIDHADDHGALWVKGKILKAPPRIKGADAFIDRMGYDAETADLPRRSQRGGQGKKQQ
jgi:hypothetical protein